MKALPKSEHLNVVRHSLAHVMADAVVKIFPGTKVAIGPAIENGFYYDFQFPDGVKPTPDDFEKIEKEMRRIIASGASFERKELSRNDALTLFADEPYKTEIIQDLPGGKIFCGHIITPFRNGISFFLTVMRCLFCNFFRLKDVLDIIISF